MQKIATEVAATATLAKKHITDEIGNTYIFKGQILTIMIKDVMCKALFIHIYIP